MHFTACLYKLVATDFYLFPDCTFMSKSLYCCNKQLLTLYKGLPSDFLQAEVKKLTVKHLNLFWT